MQSYCSRWYPNVQLPYFIVNSEHSLRRLHFDRIQHLVSMFLSWSFMFMYITWGSGIKIPDPCFPWFLVTRSCLMHIPGTQLNLSNLSGWFGHFNLRVRQEGSFVDKIYWVRKEPRTFRSHQKFVVSHEFSLCRWRHSLITFGHV